MPVSGHRVDGVVGYRICLTQVLSSSLDQLTFWNDSRIYQADIDDFIEFSLRTLVSSMYHLLET